LIRWCSRSGESGDVVKSTTRFVGFQSQGETQWPDHVLPRIELSGGSIVDRVRWDRIDLDLLSKRTETISRAVVIPFIPLLLMLAARNSLEFGACSSATTSTPGHRCRTDENGVGDFGEITRAFAALIRSQPSTRLWGDALTREMFGTI